MADFVEVTSALDRWEDWCSAWSARAAVHERLGREALASGHGLTAGELLTTAAVCYHFAKFLFVSDLDQQRAAHRRAVDCHTEALSRLDPPGERVEIPYQGTLLAGVLRRPPGVGRPPVMLMIPGLDSAKEEFTTNQAPFLARGIATLAVDGPGQGEAEYDLPIRGDYEVPVTAACDWLEDRDDLDTGRIGLWGVSLGGYYAPRAAAFEPRVRACLALGGPYTFADSWDQVPSLTREAFRVRSHLETDEQAREHAATLSLEGVAERITCPLFVVFGKQDRLIPYQAAERLAAEASGPTTLLLVPDGGHIANNRPYVYRSQSADWMAEQLAPTGPDAVAARG
ncbi:MAG: alpha/beta fold hydrolase [Nitriliruptorales bacterium]|nr:alpha/beta fold hydrolase [Nitriliruptorales bacterium]